MRFMLAKRQSQENRHLPSRPKRKKKKAFLEVNYTSFRSKTYSTFYIMDVTEILEAHQAQL
jgi:hypothetical protein